jgi:hypothetical protein
MFGGLDAEVFYGPDDSLFYSNDGDFVPFPGQVTTQPGLYQFRFKSGQGDEQGRIGICRVVVDVPDVIERFDDVAVPAGGIRLALTQDWHQIENIQLTLQSDGGMRCRPNGLTKTRYLGR